MPRVTQYIRNDDLAAWNALDNKSEFIHIALHSPLIMGLPDPKNPYPESIFVANAENIGTDKPAIREMHVKYCKNDHIIPEGRSKCTVKGCKYS